MVERVTTPKPVVRTTAPPTTTPSYYERSTVRVTTPQYSYRRPSGEMIEDINNMIKMYKNKKKRPEIEVSNSGNSGMSVTGGPGYHSDHSGHSPSPYDYYTPRPKSPSPTPYEFYSPSPTTPAPRRPDVSRPKSDSNIGHHNDRDSHRKPGHPPPGPHRPPFRQNPFQSFLNPFRNIFSFGGNRPPPPPPNRRQHSGGPPDHKPQESLPPSLPPPENFPDFHDDTNNNYDDIMQPHRRKKKPRRPLFDDRYKQEQQSDRGTFQDLIENKKYAGDYMSDRKTTLYRKRPSYDSFYDMDYSPSDKKETLTTALTTQPVETEKTVPSTAFKPQVKPTKKYHSPSDVGVFNPGSIESESGFVPVVPSNGNSPGLAFSIFDDNQEYENYADLIDRSGTVYDLLDALDEEYADMADVTDVGDRGKVVVDIPAQVLPYVPRAISRSLDVSPDKNELQEMYAKQKSNNQFEGHMTNMHASQSHGNVDPWDATILRNTGHHVDMSSPDIRSRSGHTSILAADQPSQATVAAGDQADNSADFHEFQTVAGADDGLKIRKVHDIHLSSKQLESAGPLLLSVGSSLSYGGHDDQVDSGILSTKICFNGMSILDLSGSWFSRSCRISEPSHDVK